MAIRGSLKEASLPDVLQLLSMGKKTGCLSVSDRNNFGSIFFDRGRITYASIVNRRDRLGDMLLKTGMIAQEQLEAAITAQDRQRGKRIGELLIAQGAITADQLYQSIRVQIEEAVYFLFTWTQGTFNFEADVLPDARDMLVSINPESLLLEGARRVDEWELIEKKISTFDMVFEADRARLMATDAELTDEQRAVLELVDGLRDVHAIIDSSGLVEFDVCKALYGLVSAGFIHRIGNTVRAPAQLPSDTARIEEHRNLGIAFYKTAMLDEAVREFRRVLELSPNDPSAQRFMGLALARREHWSEAASAFQEASAHASAKYGVHHDLAFALERLGRLVEARAALDEAVRRGGEADPRVVTSVGIVHLLSGDLSAADASFSEARDLMDESNPPTSWFHHASLAAALRGHLPRASAILEEGIAVHPQAASLANNLAVILERRGLIDAARDVIERGLSEGSGLSQLHKNLGDLQYRAGRFDDAFEAYRRAAAINPELGGDVYLRLGNIHLWRREHGEAVRCWERALALDPANEIVRANLESIDEVMS